MRAPPTPAELAFLDRLRWATDRLGGPATLARLLGTSVSTTAEWFRWPPKLPSARWLIELPLALGVSGHWLLTGEGHPADYGGEFGEGVAWERERLRRALECEPPAS